MDDLMDEDRSWMYKKLLENGQLNRSWYNGVLHFVEYAFSNKQTVSVREGEECISCPCKLCDNMYFLNRDTIVRHLLSGKFCSNYLCWSEHGEGNASEPFSTSASNENQQRMDEMLHDAVGPYFNWADRNVEQQPNLKAKEFFQMLSANEEALWEIDFAGEQKIKYEKHSVLSAVIKCLSLKAEHQLSQKCFDGMMEIIKSMLPEGGKLPTNFYKCKRLVSGLIMDYKKYDICPKFCMLYYGDRLHKEICDYCGEDRYEPQTNPKKKKVAKKTLRYLPITQRLQRLFMTRANAEHMQWHKEGGNQEFFQDEQPDCPISISMGHEFIWDNVLIEAHEFEPVNPDELSYRTFEDMPEVEQYGEIHEEQVVEEEEIEEPQADNSDEDW